MMKPEHYTCALTLKFSLYRYNGLVGQIKIKFIIEKRKGMIAILRRLKVSISEEGAAVAASEDDMFSNLICPHGLTKRPNLNRKNAIWATSKLQEIFYLHFIGIVAGIIA